MNLPASSEAVREPQLALGLDSNLYQIYHADAFDWLDRAMDNSLEAVVTDPPYGFEEYKPIQLEKMRSGKGGIWRIPPAFDGTESP